MEIFRNAINYAKGPFIKNTFFLTIGTALAQILTIVTAPIITRLYNPSDYGFLTIYLALIGFFSSFITFSFELAIPLEKNRKKSVELTIFSLSMTFLQAAIIVIFLISLSKLINIASYNKIIEEYSYLLYIAFILSGFFNTFIYWGIREKIYKVISKTKIKQTCTMITAQIALGFFSTGPTGLIIGHICNLGVGTIYLGKKFIKTSKDILSINYSRIYNTAKKHKKYPIYTSSSVFFSKAGTFFPPLAIVFLYGAETAGLFGLATRILSLPTGLLADSVSQVYYREAAQKLEKDFLSFKKLYYKVLIALLLISTCFMLPSFIILSLYIGEIFGPTWDKVKIFIVTMIPMAMCQFTVGSLGQTFFILNEQKKRLLYDVVRFGLISVYFVICYFLNVEVKTCIYFFSCTVCFSYLSLLIIMGSMVKKRHKDALFLKKFNVKTKEKK